MSNYPDGVSAADIDFHFGEDPDFAAWCEAVEEAYDALPTLYEVTDCNPEQSYYDFEDGVSPADFAQKEWEYLKNDF